VALIMGTNGGGFFNANSARPFESPNALTNLIQMLLIFSIGAALGRMVGSQLQGWRYSRSWRAVPRRRHYGLYRGVTGQSGLHRVPRRSGADQAGGNMEDKELRFGLANSVLFTTVTTDTSDGAVNNMHDSLLPLAGMVPMVNIMLGEIIFGVVGSGLYGMLLFVIVAMLVAGLMVGRTPEYLGKKARGEGGQDGHACHTDPATVDPWLHCSCRCASSRHRCNE
jgi:K+-transporting ATPase ATPase A chain